ncbi:YwqG family protein [Algoriphagus sediminis]|uniref:YwqG family protein n=1 Tax=Algoriphagus sediminis TaxID=3057113 RepID=A0ABT7YBS0_9BACT|nr:YwqG family protein [Algoriphagus sediminis]MDN3203976.1 YwqG family protein [Algoriphagus sediminis]
MIKKLGSFVILVFISCSQVKSPDSRDPTKERYLKAIQTIKWSSGIENIEALLRPGIKVVQDQSIDKQGLGVSRFGGTPDLPEGLNWPTFEDNPMVFLAQINLSEIEKLDLDKELPNSGMIYFFVHFNKPENQFGTYYEFIFDKSEYKVIYSESQKLENVPFPQALLTEYRFVPQRMSFETIYTFPSYETLEVRSMSPTDQEKAYNLNYSFGNQEIQQILGYTSPVQTDVTFDWAFSYLNYQTYDLDELDRAKIDSVRPTFINLLQFTLANPQTGFNKIGSSTGYFGITKQDLQNKKFENTILVFQDT